MTKTCPSCDILAPPDARYCRHCGMQLKRVGEAGDGISPIANTVPLSNQNTTDEIVAHPAPQQSAAAHTSEVSRAEMNDMLRSGNGSASSPPQQHNSPSDDFDPEQTQITIPVRPLTSRDLPADAAAAAAAVATRTSGKPQFNSAPQQVTLSPTGSLQPATAPATTTNAPHPSPASTAARSTESRALRVWLGAGLAILSIVAIGCVVVAMWFGSRAWRGEQAPTPAVTASGETGVPATDDPKQLADAKLREADALIAAGNASEAQARLREAAVLDPSNVEPHRRLSRLLLANGSRREAIEELRAVVRLAPEDAEAWRSLASAQQAEGLYEDALESYRGLGEASPAALARDAVQLAYADALRSAGRSSDARVIYRRLATSADADVAAASRRQLGLPSPSPTDEEVEAAKEQALETAARGESRAEDAGRTTPEANASPAPQPTVAAARVETASAASTTTSATPPRASGGSPSEQYQRGVGLWPTNRAAAIAEFRAAAERGNSDASYYLGLSIAEGRDPRALKRAELVAAIVYFGRARRGKFRAQSVAYEEQLGRELDRRRNVER
ncbi:MAG TPA: tetratricopeptide repeat protein [Pyrinomonadaceae bacterium]|nr:tetratricopeptide repeat protein [Pyrinomonadaceae bacterium]